MASALLSASAQDNPRISTMDLSAAELAYYMAPGWNLGNTMEAGSYTNNFTNNGGTSTETSWQSTKTTQEIVDMVKENGFNSIRIPCAWVMGHISDADNMTIDADWLARVKEVVDYAINANMYVLLNDHWDGGWMEYDGFTTGADVDTKKEQLRKLWTNIANAFIDYDERLLFGGLNEPGVGSASPDASGSLLSLTGGFVDRLYEYEQTFIDAVRATGGNNAKRVLVVQGPNTSISDTNNYFDITKLTDSAEDRLMLEIHHYDPYQFTMMTEDASWGYVYYYWEGYSPNRASSSRIASNSLRDEIQSNMNTLKTNFVDKGYPVIVGEYGCDHKTYASTVATQSYHDSSVQYWYEFSTEYAYEAGLIPFAWDTNGTSRPTMSVFSRSKLAINDQNIYDGIFAGDTNGRSAYETIYPEPSSTSGIHAVTAESGASVKVYDLQGRQVAADGSALNDGSLAPGIYIVGGKKVIVK